ncbi:MAG: calcium-binding protein, partial [Paracoccaceae bacterium]
MDSYLQNAHRQLYDFNGFLPDGLGNTYLAGGNQADELQNFFGLDTLLGGGGDDVIRASGGVYPNRVAPAGVIFDGGSGFDRLEVSGGGPNGVDFSRVTLRSIEALTLFSTSLRLSGDQIGNGGLSLTATLLLSGPNLPLIIDQTAGKSVDLSRMNIFFSPTNQTVINGTAGNDVQMANRHSNDLLFGLDGNDRLFGGGGFDSLYGGNDDDVLVAGDDPTPTAPFQQSLRDELYGGDGNDRLTGGNSQALLSGDGGNDTLYGGTGLTIVSGGDGDDWLLQA